VKTGNITAAVFRHETSREQEPQLHSHCVVINTTQLADGSWRGLGNEQAIAHQKLLGEIYQNELAFQLRQQGYEIEHCGTGQFELKGYSQALMNVFSTRTQQIEKYLEKLQSNSDRPLSASQRKQATLATRKSKKVVPREVLMSAWEGAIARQNLSLPPLPEPNPALSVNQSVNSTVNSLTAIQAGINHASERIAIFSRTQVERFALEHSLGQQRFRDLQSAIDSSHELIQVDATREKYTTQTAIQRELATIRLMQNGQGQVEAIATIPEVSAHLANSSLTAGQREAIALAATTQDQIMAWQGVAGAGKTYSLELFKELAEAKGYTVKGFAPSAEAAKGLEKAAQIPSETIAHLLHTKPDPPLLGKEIWIVDEAGLLSAKDAHELLTKATEQSARVILVGDTRQLSSVGAGNPFKSLQSGGIQTAYLAESLRQKTQVLRAAIASIAAGEISAGIEQLDNGNMIREIPESGDRLQQIAQDYLALTPEERQATLVIVGTNVERRILAQQIRAGLQAKGALGADVFTFQGLKPKDLTIAQAKYVHHYEVGDVIVPIQNYKKQGLLKSQQYQVLAIAPSQNQVSVVSESGNVFSIDPAQCDRKTVYQSHPISVAVGDCLQWTRSDRNQNIRNGQSFTIQEVAPKGQAQITDEDGKTFEINLSGYQYADYAQVSTRYSSQGKTADRVLATVDRLTGKEAFYVTVSRAKFDLTLYVANKVELPQTQISRAKENPSEYLPLFRSTHHAQTQETHASAPNPDGGKRIGASVNSVLAPTLRRDRQLETAGGRLDRRTSELAAAHDHTQRLLAEFHERIGQQSGEDGPDFESIAAVFANRIEQRTIERITEAIGEVAESLDGFEQTLGFQPGDAAADLRDAAGTRPGDRADASRPGGGSAVLELWHRYSQGLENHHVAQVDTIVGVRAHEDGHGLDEITEIISAGSAVVRRIQEPQEAKEYLVAKIEMIRDEIFAQWQMEDASVMAHYQELYRRRTQGMDGLSPWERDVRVARVALKTETDLKEVIKLVAQSPVLMQTEQVRGRDAALRKRVAAIGEARRQNFVEVQQRQEQKRQRQQQKTKQRRLGLEME
jgi:ATP-dependent exoDNAse (exonuclease V) alpha subunit